MLRALFLGFRQLLEPSSRRLLLRCLLLAILTFVLLVAAVGALLGVLDLTGFGWLDTGLAIAGSAGTVVLAWLLFPVTIALALGFFAEEVADEVERRHYPELPPAVGMAIGDSVRGALRFGTVALLLNLLVLPLYLLPGANLLIYLALNGYLLGREYFELVAGRRLPGATVGALRRRRRGRLWLAGVIIAAMLAVPFFNLVAPVVAIAFMVHLFEGLRRERGATDGFAGLSTPHRPAAARAPGDRSI
jgi:CysZ protein